MNWVERGRTCTFRHYRYGRGRNHGHRIETDVAIVGFGWVGAIAAAELTEAGLNVVALERGPMRDTQLTAPYPQVIDELTYNIRRKLFGSVSTVTIRHNTSQAVPCRFSWRHLPGTGVGGSRAALVNVHFRVDHQALRMRSHYEEAPLRQKLHSPGYDHPSFGVTYDELEPFFDKSPEKVFGTSGTAWSIKGKVVGKGRGGNAFAPDRSDDFRCRRRKTPVSAAVEKAALEVGYHPTTCRRPTPPTPIPTPMARRWVRATSAVSAAATPATCTLKPRRT